MYKSFKKVNWISACFTVKIPMERLWPIKLSNQRVQICNKKGDIFIHFIIPAKKERLISKTFEIKLWWKTCKQQDRINAHTLHVKKKKTTQFQVTTLKIKLTIYERGKWELEYSNILSMLCYHPYSEVPFLRQKPAYTSKTDSNIMEEYHW